MPTLMYYEEQSKENAKSGGAVENDLITNPSREPAFQPSNVEGFISSVQVEENKITVTSCNWDKWLPSEILEKIFSCIEDRDLWNCLSVCRRWRQIANSNRLWKRHCLRLSIEEEAPSNLLDESPLCSWATAFYLYHCRPIANWRAGRFVEIDVPVKAREHISIWDGRLGYIYYYTLGRVVIHRVSDDNKLELVEQINVEKLNMEDSHFYPSLVLNSDRDRLAIGNCNIIQIFKRIDGHYWPTHCLSCLPEEVIASTDIPNFDFFILNHISTEYILKMKHFLGDTVWLYHPVARTFLVFDINKGEIKYHLDYRNLISRPNIPLLVSLHAKKVEVYDKRCEVILTIEETCISSVCFNWKTLVANKLSFKAGTTARNLQSWDIPSGKELALMEEVRATDIHLHPISSKMIVLEVEKHYYAISCYDARTGKVYWQITDPNQHSWFPDLRIVMYDFVIIAPAYNDNDKFSIYELKSGSVIEERLMIHSDVYFITDLLWVIDKFRYISIKSFI